MTFIVCLVAGPNDQWLKITGDQMGQHRQVSCDQDLGVCNREPWQRLNLDWQGIFMAHIYN